MSTFSIIIPAYNVSKYLKESVDSVLNQTYSDWECWIIDDGSTDPLTAQMCDEYTIIDSRIKTFHKKNGGVSSARNAGLDLVSGDWILFLDGDDYTDSDYLMSLSKHLDTDFIATSHVEILKDTQITRSIFDKDKALSQKDIPNFLATHLNTMSCISTWAKAYKRSIIEENHLRFDTTMRYSEDCIFMNQYLQKINSAFFISKPLYNFRLYKPEPVKRFTYALSNEDVIRHIDLLSKAYDEVSKIQHFECLGYVSFQAFVFLRNYCRFLEKNNQWREEPLYKIKNFFNHPFVNKGLFGKPKTFCIKDYLYYLIYRCVNIMNLHRQLLILLNRYYTK